MTPQQIAAISAPIESVYAQIVDDLLINIGKHLTSGTWTARWEVEKLSEMGQLTKENAAIINKYVKSIPKEVYNALSESRKEALAQIETALANAPMPLSDSTLQVVQDLSAQAIDQFNLVNTTMSASARQLYANGVSMTLQTVNQMQAKALLGSGATSVAVGAETRVEALRKTIRRLSDIGITGFTDKAGRNWTPEAYVNMNIRTTVHNTALKAADARMQDYGVDVFQVSSHGGARPLCYPYQGKFYSNSGSAGEIELGNGKTVKYEPLSATSYGEPAGLFGINCRHYKIPVLPGISIPHGKDFIQPEGKNDKQYAISQEQRRLERNVRYAKREQAMLGPLAGPEEASRVKAAQAKSRAFAQQNKLTRRYDREQIR